MKRAALVLFMLVWNSCHAEYVRTGPVMATVCRGIGIKFCGPVEVKVLEIGGKLYEPAESYAAVDGYKNKKCHIRTSSDGVLSAALNGMRMPNFYTEENDKYVKISPDYVTFQCRER